MTSRLPERSLLDAGILPVGEIAHLARREAIRPRDVYQSHKWFARRLAATARSLLVAATTPDDSNFWSAYYDDASCEGMAVLDPFMGGGVMLLEAWRLGADVHGVDVEPVAAAVSDFQGQLLDVPDLSPHLNDLFDAVGKEMASFYRAFDESGQEERLLHAFWVQSVECAGCGSRYDAHPSFRLAWNDKAGSQFVACSRCSAIHEGDAGSITCHCGVVTDPLKSHVLRGKARCPGCGHEENLIDLPSRTGRPADFRMFAVETLPAGDERRFTGAERRIRTATGADRDCFEQAQARLDQEMAADPDFWPECPVPTKNRSDNRLLRYGHATYATIYNARQRLHLGLLAKAISGIDGIAGRALRIAFSDHLTTNNLLCGYAGGWRRLSPLFAMRSFRHIARPVEINPWLCHNGRGTFAGAVRAVQKAGADLIASREPSIKGASVPVPARKKGAWDIRCGDALDLSHIADASVDLVLTDPPYFDYIAYSELGHFYAPWMKKLGLIDPPSMGSFPVGQLASPKRGASAVQIFADALALRLTEVVRTCKPTARIAFTYQNLSGEGWRALGIALAKARIKPFAIFPMFGDSGSALHKKQNSICWDCVVVAKISGIPLSFEEEAVVTVCDDRIDLWKTRLLETGHPFGEGDALNMRHASWMMASIIEQDEAIMEKEEPAVA